ncbi:MAG: PhnD/SsuA/transferrin family substrate-binding protein [Gammaproteobacteria bacterium]|nr:PhnD/SsuA/transferrin family substrate-binding protein [Gammaproteobacteria bacterium]
MSRHLYTWARPALACMLMLLQSSALAELILTAPPRESLSQGEAIYGPIAKHFSRVTGQNVSYVHPDNWLNYQQQMRKGKYDIVFDGPHFMSWRMANLNHSPLAKLEGQLRFILISKTDQTDINDIGDLVGRKICGLPPPNLATLTMFAEFQNPVRQPIFVGIRGGFGQVYRAFQEGQCDAAVFRDSFYKGKISEPDKKAVKIIFTSNPLPNQGFTVDANKLPAAMQRDIMQSLLSDAGIEATRPLLQRFAKNTHSLLPASESEYTGHNRYIEGVIFGW